MALYINDRYRIRRNVAQEENMKYLIQELNVFQSYSQILVISALIGYINDACAEFTKSDTVLMNSFNRRSYDIMDFIAYACTKNQSLLTSEDNTEKYRYFENFANGGFPILIKKLGINFEDKTKNDRFAILRKYYMMLITKDFKEL